MLYSSIYHVSYKVFILCIFVYMVCEDGIGLCLVCGMFVLFVCCIHVWMVVCDMRMLVYMLYVLHMYIVCSWACFFVVLDVDKQTTPNYILRS